LGIIVSEQGNIKRIFLSACEASGDAHCANLIKSLERMVSESAGKEEGGLSGIEFVGVGGQKMAEGGCELLEDTVRNAAMI
jgi:lipid A disaccharide synthetase